MNTRIQSPLIHEAQARLIQRLQVRDIVTAYRDEKGVDVLSYFRDLSEIRIFECERTGYRFFHPFQIQGDEKFYTSLHRAESESTYYRDLSFDHLFALKQLRPNQSLLDIGCGSGTFLNQAKMHTHQVLGIEQNPNALEILRQNEIRHLAGEIITTLKSLRETFDIITLFQVLEHITHPAVLLDEARKLLKPGGSLIISLPNSNPYFQRHHVFSPLNLPPHHMGLWNLKTMRTWAREQNWTLHEILFSSNPRVVIDAYLRGQKWLGIRPSYPLHRLSEKIMIASLLPLSLILSMKDKMMGKLEGDFFLVRLSKD